VARQGKQGVKVVALRGLDAFPENSVMPVPITLAATLEAALSIAASDLLSVLQRIGPEHWTRVPGPSVWSIGKDAAHVAEAAVYHQWIVRLTIGEATSSGRPVIERRELTTAMTPVQTMALIRTRTDEGAALIARLGDDALALATRPPRAGSQTLADTIELVLIDHYRVHRRDIERKLRALELGEGI
jgi:hypothetical protein